MANCRILTILLHSSFNVEEKVKKPEKWLVTEDKMIKCKNIWKPLVILFFIFYLIITNQNSVHAKNIYDLENDSFENKQKLTRLNDWMKTNLSGHNSMPGRGIPGLWNFAFSDTPPEGKLYVKAAMDSEVNKNVTIKNVINRAFYNDSQSQMLILPPGSSRADQVIENADEYALYTPGGELTTQTIGRNEDNSAELEITASASAVKLKLRRLKEGTNLPENATLNTNFTFNNVKSAMDVFVGAYLNRNTGSGAYSSMLKGYYYSTTNVKVDMSKYLAPDRLSLNLKQEEVTIYKGDKWNPAQYFKNATDIDGNQLNYSQLTNVKDEVNSEKQGSYQVIYTNGDIKKKIIVHVIQPLVLEVPDSVHFGSYKLGSSSSKLLWDTQARVSVESYLSGGWVLSASLNESSNDFQNYIMNGTKKLIDNELIAISDDIGKTDVSNSWNQINGIHIDYSRATELRKDTAIIEWTLSPNTKGVTE